MQQRHPESQKFLAIRHVSLAQMIEFVRKYAIGIGPNVVCEGIGP
jgi:hypothetical protein